MKKSELKEIIKAEFLTEKQDSKKGNEDEQKRMEGAIRDDRDHIKDLKKDIEANEKKLAKLKKDYKKDVVKEEMDDVEEMMRGGSTYEEDDINTKIQMGSEVVDDYFIEGDVSDDERMILNMGPQHPSTHGVLRLQVELEGEVVRRVQPVIGYLHTGMEKTGEELNYFQGPTNTTRMDYLSPFFNELVFSLATEKLLDIEVPER